jgi:hypothetical protein
MGSPRRQVFLRSGIDAHPASFVSNFFWMPASAVIAVINQSGRMRISEKPDAPVLRPH